MCLLLLFALVSLEQPFDPLSHSESVGPLCHLFGHSDHLHSSACPRESAIHRGVRKVLTCCHTWQLRRVRFSSSCTSSGSSRSIRPGRPVGPGGSTASGPPASGMPAPGRPIRLAVLDRVSRFAIHGLLPLLFGLVPNAPTRVLGWNQEQFLDPSHRQLSCHSTHVHLRCTRT
jgi:hypothetical protein